MAKLMLIRKTEVSVPEDKKGKQIAVKESNVTSLKNFYISNYKPSIEMPSVVDVPQNNEPVIDNIAPIPAIEPTPVEVSHLNTVEPSIINPMMGESVINPNGIEEQTPVVDNTPVIETPIMSAPQPMVLESAIVDPMEPEVKEENTELAIDTPVVNGTFTFPNPIIEEGTNDTEAIKLVQDNDVISDLVVDEEMDPELKEIKNRLDQVILDLNNYKKKIKMLENEVNQNLEKSREVLKDTQAAAKIMSIHQERQNQIMSELNGNTLNDSTRILQKEVA